MKVHFSQIYIKAGIGFPFSHRFQVHLSDAITELVEPSPTFVDKYGSEFDIIIRISAKKDIGACELNGPTVFSAEKDVEYTVFLPFDTIHHAADSDRSALEFLLDGVALALGSLDINADRVDGDRAKLVDRILSDPTMFKRRTSPG